MTLSPSDVFISAQTRLLRHPFFSTTGFPRLRAETVQVDFSNYDLSGGPIRAGLPVRISYYEDENFQADILRLDIRADSVPSAAERSAYAKTEEQKWQRTTADDPRNQAMTLGFLMASFAWTLWWNIDWQRFIKFYGVSGPPYRRWIEVAFRGFFALCSLGAGRELLRQLLERSRPAHIMVKALEWLSNRRKKVRSPNELDATE